MRNGYAPVVYGRFGGPAASLFDSMDRLAEQMGMFPFEGSGGLSAKTDLYRKDGKLCVEAELPGIKPEDVELHVYGDRLTLSAEKRSERTEGTEGKSYFRSERSYGKVERMISFPVEVDPESAKASFRNGVLTVEMTEKSQEKGYRKVAVSSEA